MTEYKKCDCGKRSSCSKCGGSGYVKIKREKSFWEDVGDLFSSGNSSRYSCSTCKDTGTVRGCRGESLVPCHDCRGDDDW